MAKTDVYRRQHGEILGMVDALTGMLNETSLDASKARTSLSNVVGKARVHLAMEDQSLYPDAFSREQTRVMAQSYQREMGDLAASLIDFSRRWTLAAMESEPASFCQEATQIFKALRERIQREETELYPLIDRS